MELNPTTVALGMALLAGVVWLVRLESKANSTSADVDELYQKTDQHILDREIHHDAKDLNRRFSDIGRELSEIKGMVKDGLDKLTERFDNFLSK